MRSIQDLEKILETAKNNNPNKYKRVKNKLSPEQLGILEDAIMSRRLISATLSDLGYMNICRNELSAYLGYELLPLLFTEEELLKYATDVLHKLSYCEDLSDWRNFNKRATFKEVYGFIINERKNKIPTPIVFSTWHEAYKSYRDKWYYPDCFLNEVISRIIDRKDLTEQVKIHDKTFSSATFLSFTYCLEYYIIPRIGTEEFTSYLSDMAKEYTQSLNISDRNHIPARHLETAVFGLPILDQTVNPNRRKSTEKSGFSLKDNLAKCYYRAYLPYICANYTQKEKFVEHIKTVCDFNDDEWNEITKLLEDPSLYIGRTATKDNVVLNAASVDKKYSLPGGTSAYEINKRLDILINESVKKRIPLYKKDCWDALLSDKDLVFANDIKATNRKERLEDTAFVRSLIDKAIIKSKELIKEDNIKEIKNSNKTVWTLAIIRKGKTLEFATVDFSNLTKTFTDEIRIIALEEYTRNREKLNLYKINLIIEACQFFIENYHLYSFSDITGSHIALYLHHCETNKKYSVLSLKNIITALRFGFDILINSNKEYGYKPIFNPAKNISLPNVPAFINNTPAIPDEVLSELDRYIIEADSETQLVYEILMQTGWRIGDIQALSDDCTTIVDADNGIAEICVATPKTGLRREAKGYDPFIYSSISLELYNQIQQFISDTASDRESYKINTLFYIIINNKADHYRANTFNKRIQKLCKRHNLMTIEQEYWSVSSRQPRKTVAVHLISSGASLTAVQNQLGHMEPHTTEMYYAEVQRKTIAELNNKFFQRNYSEPPLEVKSFL